MEFNCNAIESQTMCSFTDPHELTGQQRGLVKTQTQSSFSASSTSNTLSMSALCLCCLELRSFWVSHCCLWIFSVTVQLFTHHADFLVAWSLKTHNSTSFLSHLTVAFYKVPTFPLFPFPLFFSSHPLDFTFCTLAFSGWILFFRHPILLIFYN